MDSFSGKLAVVTGGGSGMGRELVRQLAAQGCSVGACDVNADAVAETATLARAGALPGVVRAKPEAAYDYALLASMAPNAPRPGGLAPRSPDSPGNPDAPARGRVLP